MKHKGKNRVLAALLAAAMMFQMLPLMVFADDGAASSDVKIEGKEGTYTSLKEAVEKAESGDTIRSILFLSGRTRATTSSAK